MENIYIPLGEECYTCQSIDGKFSNSLRKTAFPFDYVGHTYVEKIYDNLHDLFINNETQVEKENFHIQQFDEKYYFVNKKYDFKYWHDISGNNNIFLDEENNNFIDKYNRRYKRLYDVINSNKLITIISVNHFDNIYKNTTKKDEIIKLFNLLYSLNNNIKFLAFNFNDEDCIYDNLQFINLPVNTTIEFTKSKELFTTELYKYIKNNIMDVNFLNEYYNTYECIFDNNVTLKIPDYKNYNDEDLKKMFSFYEGGSLLLREPKKRQIISNLINKKIVDKNKNFIDGGSFLGDTSLPLCLNINGLVYSIDPGDINVSIIEKLSNLNNIDNIVILKYCLGDKYEKLFYNEGIYGINFKSFTSITSTTCCLKLVFGKALNVLL